MKIIASLCLALLLTSPALAAITGPTVTNSTPELAVTTHTTSVTVASCTQCVLLACVVQEGNTGVKPTGITFNTTENFTEVVTVSRTNGGVEYIATFFRLVNPTVTTANAVVSFNATANNDRALGASFLLYQGVDQSTPVEDSNSASNTGTTLTVSVNTVTANALVVDCALGDHNGGLTVDPAQTMRVDRVINTVDGQGVSDIAVVSPGAQSMIWTQTTEDWSQVALVLKAHVAAGACTGALLLMGAGGC